MEKGVVSLESATHRYIDIDDIRLHVAEAGDPNGPLVVLLHGFPEFWYAWRHQIPSLARAGFHVVAPDLRGYNLSDKPSAVIAYRLELLAHDVARLIDALGYQRAHVVGHDWGGAVAWTFATRYPDLLDRLVALNIPHPERMTRALRMPRQWLRSSYMLFFQLPWLPETLFRAGDAFVLRRALQRDPARLGAFTDADLARYRKAWSQPGALTGGLNYYRAAFRRAARLARSARGSRPIVAPVLIIWGRRDRFLLPELARPNPVFVPNARIEWLPNASHWVMTDARERVNELLIEFLVGNETTAFAPIPDPLPGLRQ
jgi:epoxide hydrolase 4